jgi:ribosomal protein S6
MFIFPESLKDEVLEETVGRVRGEIEKLGGAIDSVTRLGKRGFARPLAKRHTAGHYAVINFHLAGEHLAALRERLKLGGEVFRSQFVRLEEAPAKGTPDGVAQ